METHSPSIRTLHRAMAMLGSPDKLAIVAQGRSKAAWPAVVIVRP
jgi:hypothetical protein